MIIIDLRKVIVIYSMCLMTANYSSTNEDSNSLNFLVDRINVEFIENNIQIFLLINLVENIV